MINHPLQFSSLFAQLLAQDICFDAKNFNKKPSKSKEEAKPDKTGSNIQPTCDGERAVKSC